MNPCTGCQCRIIPHHRSFGYDHGGLFALRLAVFNNRFPGFVSTFFARDMRGLLESGVEVDVFAIHPLEPELWRYVPELLNDKYLPRERVHHTSLGGSLRYVRPWPLAKFGAFLQDTAMISASAAKFGMGPLAKTAYVLLQAWVWAQEHPAKYDHILAYWGNYSGTCAYVYHRLTAPQVPFSIFLHASIDLYRDPLYLREKLLYADNILTCSDFNAQFIRDHFQDIYTSVKDKIYVHHHGLDFGELPYEIAGRSPQTIVAVGRLEKQKGFDYLLRAVHILRGRNVDPEVELIGEGGESAALKTLARELQITDKVRFRGWLPFEDVRTAMRRATLMAHPSPDLGDGVPNVIKEAMALGTPVVASHVAGIPELLAHGRCGLLVPPRDVQALAEAIETLLTNEAMRRTYADAARARTEEKYNLWRNGQRLAERLCSTTRLQHTIRTG
jgi:glycosyltransferase involved in cell wall biosynthesis